MALKSFRVEQSPGLRLDRWLSERLADRARHQIQRDIEQNRVTVDGVARPARHRVALGEKIRYELIESIESRQKHSTAISFARTWFASTAASIPSPPMLLSFC